MKAAYIGIDFLFPALPALAAEGCEILKIFTCKVDNVTEFNHQVCQYAKDHGIPLQEEKITREDLISLREQGCELVVSGGYYYRIPTVEGLYQVNIHPALLPFGRGSWPMAVTILRDLRESGVTFHKIVQAWDAGDILLQRSFVVEPDENQETLVNKQCALLPEMIHTLCTDLDRLWKNAVPQNEAEAEYWQLPTEADWTVTEDMEEVDADRILRAFYGYEVILVTGGERWELIFALLRDAPQENETCFPFKSRWVCARKARKL